MNLTCMFLGSGRKPEYPERTNAYTRRICKLDTERPLLGIEVDKLYFHILIDRKNIT